jgi:hypothetical protein
MFGVGHGRHKLGNLDTGEPSLLGKCELPRQCHRVLCSAFKFEEAARLGRREAGASDRLRRPVLLLKAQLGTALNGRSFVGTDPVFEQLLCRVAGRRTRWAHRHQPIAHVCELVPRGRAVEICRTSSDPRPEDRIEFRGSVGMNDGGRIQHANQGGHELAWLDEEPKHNHKCEIKHLCPTRDEMGDEGIDRA